MSEFYFKTIERKIRYYFLLLHHFLTYSTYSWLINKNIQKEKIKSILVVETLLIGDLIVATPIFKVLKDNFPKAKIYALVLEKYSEVLDNNPNTTEVVKLKQKVRLSSLKDFFKLFKLLKKKKINMGVILHPGSISISFLLFLLRIRYRVGCTQAGMLNGKGLFLTHKIKPYEELINVVQQNLKVLTEFNILPKSKVITEIYTTKSEEEKLIKKFNLSKKHTYIGVNACTAHPSQRWDKFPELIESILKNEKNKIILTGESACALYLNEVLVNIKNKKNIINLCGKTSLRELFGVIKQMSLLISVDSATPHIAAALNVPTITLYGPGFPEIWHPWNKKAKWIIKDKVCTRCRQHFCILSYLNKEREYECMKSIHVNDVKKENEYTLACANKN
ncbi:glycosyltransferase family 9 protein [Candidatus Woesearchaeota archaeon]|nr:glycosyltransferase family 9 protein [Candidatus Woesearchaeota archaeon]